MSNQQIILGDVEVKSDRLVMHGLRGPYEIFNAKLQIGSVNIPFDSPGWLVGALAGAALNWVGGMVFQALGKALGLGGPSLSTILSQVIAKIDQIVEQRIRDNELRKITASLDAVQSNMNEYLHNRKSVFRLQDATTRSNEIVSDARSFGLAGNTLQLCATSLHLAILQEWIFRGEDEIGNFNSFVKSSTEYSNNIKAQWLSLANSDNVDILDRYHKVVRPFAFIEPKDLPRISIVSDKAKSYILKCADLRYRDTGRINGPSGMSWIQYCKINVQQMLAEDQTLSEFIEWEMVKSLLMEKYFSCGDIAVNLWKDSLNLPSVLKS